MSVNNYRVIVHTIGFEPKTELAGTFSKLEKADGRAKALIENMRKLGQLGYVAVRDHGKRDVPVVLFSVNSAVIPDGVPDDI